MRSKGVCGYFLLLLCIFILQNSIVPGDSSELIAHWTFDDGGGTTAQDYSGNGYTATLVNGPTWTQGKLNGALRFDGENDYATTEFYPYNSPYTVMGWFKFDNFFSYQACGTHDFENHRLYFGIDGGDCYWGLGTMYHKDTALHGMSTNTWHHIAITGDGQTGKYYINAAEKDTMTYSWSGTSSTPFIIGAFANYLDRNIEGVIDDMRIYNRALSQQEIEAIYLGSEPDPDTEDPTPPTNLNATAISHSRIDLTWNPSSDNRGVMGYKIYRDDLEINTAPTTTYSDTGLSPLTEYTYRVSAYDAAGNQSTLSNPASATTLEQSPVESYTLSITATNGNVLKNPNQSEYEEGTSVELTAVPNTGYWFSSWSGDLSGSDNPATIVMDSDKSITASFSVQGSGPIARIRVEPSTTVEVGEEIYFDATGSSDDKSLGEGKFEWDFGDGYALKSDYPFYNSADGGITCTHFYMQPGTYNVTLTVTDTDSNTATTTVEVHVTGEYPKLPPRPSIYPVVELKFEGGLEDTSPNNLVAKWNGTASYTRGKEGQAADFSKGGYIEVNDPEGLLSGITGLTVSFWGKKKENIPLTDSVSLLENGAAYRFRVGSVYMTASVTTSENGSVTINNYNFYTIRDNNMWHHYVVTYDGELMRVFIDGNEYIRDNYAPKPHNGTIINSGTNLLIGKGQSTPIFNGYIDEVKIYDKALSQDEINVSFELWHGNFHGRIAQYIYVQTPGEITKDPTNKIELLVSDHQGKSYNAIENPVRTNLKSEEKFLLRNSMLPAIPKPGYYILTGKIMDSTNNAIDQVSEKFFKTYDGIPRVGLDENNAVCIDGKQFFPVTSWMLDNSRMDSWKAGKYINTLFAEGYYSGGHSVTTWKDYLDQGQNNDWVVIGDSQGWADVPSSQFMRNGNINNIINYVIQTKNHPALLSWFWKDEPELGGEGTYIPSPVVRSWTYKCHELDPHHLVTETFGGYEYLPGKYDKLKRYAYLTDADQFGGKKQHVADIYDFDIFPLEYKVTFENWAMVMDKFRNKNYDLIPIMAFIETQDIRAYRETPGPTRDQLRMEIWLCIVHNLKGVNWLHYFEPTPDENFQEMATSLRQITELTPIVLGPEPDRTVTDNANVWGNRIDTMLREDATDIWLFAVRITEVDHSNGGVLHPDEIGNRNVTFTIDGIQSSSLAFLYEEDGRSVGISSDGSKGTLTDTFAPNAVHIYRIPKDLSSDSEPPTVPDGLAAIPVSNSRIDLSWNASSDNMGVAGYKIFRDGHQIDTTFSTVYIDKGLAPLTTYTYRVAAYDGAGNESALSDPVAATTTDQSGDTIKEYDFEYGKEDWTWWSTDNYTFNEVEGTYELMPGTDDWALAMESDDTIAQAGSYPTLAYGFWQSPRTSAQERVPYIPEKLYLVRWSLVTDQAYAVNQPGLRFRISTGSDSCGGDIVLQEFNGSKIEITTNVDNPTILEHYWYPPQWLVNENIALYPEQTGLYLAADMYDNRKSATGKYWIPRVEVLALDPPDAVTPVFSAPPFDTSSNIWRDTTQSGYVDSWIDSEDGLSIRFPQNGDNLRSCYWEFVDPSASIQLGADTLYRVTFTVTSSGSKPPVFRERLIVRNLYLGSETVITPTIPQGYVFDYAIPGSTPREVICYLGINDQYLVGDDLIFSMDVYSAAEGTDPYDGTYNVTDIKVEQLNIP